MSNEHQKRFVVAFFKGMAAPAYALEPSKMPDIPNQPVKPKIAKTVNQALKSDWRKIGMDFSVSIDRKQKTLARD